MRKCVLILKRLPALVLLALIGSLEMASASHGHDGYELKGMECTVQQDSDCQLCEYQLLTLSGLPPQPELSLPEKMLVRRSGKIVTEFTSAENATSSTRGPPSYFASSDCC